MICHAWNLIPGLLLKNNVLIRFRVGLKGCIHEWFIKHGFPALNLYAF